MSALAVDTRGHGEASAPFTATARPETAFSARRGSGGARERHAGLSRVYILATLVWFWAGEGVRPDWADLAGASLCLDSAAIILLARSLAKPPESHDCGGPSDADGCCRIGASRLGETLNSRRFYVETSPSFKFVSRYHVGSRLIISSMHRVARVAANRGIAMYLPVAEPLCPADVSPCANSGRPRRISEGLSRQSLAGTAPRGTYTRESRWSLSTNSGLVP